MGVRSAFGTVGRYVAAVTGLYFTAVPGLVLLVLAVNTSNGNYATPETGLRPLADVVFLVSLLLGAWFVVEGHSLKRLFAFVVSVFVLFGVALGVTAVVESAFEPFGVESVVVAALLLVGFAFVYLGAYRLVCPSSFAERTWQFEFDA